MRQVRALVGSIVLLHFMGAVLWAGGPLRFTNAGPTVWKTDQKIGYRIDDGPLGPLDAPTIQTMIQLALGAWENVSTASIAFVFEGPIMPDVTTGIEYEALEQDDTSGNIIILDSNGDIIADLTGEGNRRRILGWAAPISNNVEIFRFYSLMNGSLVGRPEDFQSTLVHEIGHAIGLDHSQINARFVGDGLEPNDDHIPTMYPTSSDDDERLATLNPDDVAWISVLYPAGNLFSTKYGHLRGTLERANGNPVLGANIIAIRVVNGALSRHLRFSCVSDWLAANDGSFAIPVEPGKYRIKIEPIRLGFDGGSSVGPHSETATSPSFDNPIQQKEFVQEFTVTAGNETDVGKLVAD